MLIDRICFECNSVSFLTQSLLLSLIHPLFLFLSFFFIFVLFNTSFIYLFVDVFLLFYCYIFVCFYCLSSSTIYYYFWILIALTANQYFYDQLLKLSDSHQKCEYISLSYTPRNNCHVHRFYRCMVSSSNLRRL